MAPKRLDVRFVITKFSDIDEGMKSLISSLRTADVGSGDSAVIPMKLERAARWVIDGDDRHPRPRHGYLRPAMFHLWAEFDSRAELLAMLKNVPMSFDRSDDDDPVPIGKCGEIPNSAPNGTWGLWEITGIHVDLPERHGFDHARGLNEE